MSTDDTWEDVSIGRMFAYAHRHHRAFLSSGQNNMSELMVEHLLDYLLAIPAARRQFVRACWSLLGLAAPIGTPTYTT